MKTQLHYRALITGSKYALSCGLAFVLFHWLHLRFGYWAVVSVAAVTRPGFSFTINKMLMRFMATVLGAIAGYLIAITAMGHVWVIVPLFFIGVMLSCFLVLQDSVFDYLGIIFGLTLTLVIAASLETGLMFDIAVYRTVAVMLGILCVFVVNVALAAIFARYEPFEVNVVPKVQEAWHLLLEHGRSRRFLRQAFVMAAAATLTFVPWAVFRYPGGFWATISCFFILEETKEGVNKRCWLRFLSHVVAAAIGMVCAYFIGGHGYAPLWPLMISFFVFGMVMVHSKAYSGSCNTMMIALSVMLLANPTHAGEMHTVIWRFINVVGGILVGILVAQWMLTKSN